MSVRARGLRDPRSGSGEARMQPRARNHSIADRDRIETAPNVPSCDRPVRRPGLAEFPRLGTRHRLAAEVVDTDSLDEADVVERKNIGPKQMEDEEHLRRP